MTSEEIKKKEEQEKKNREQLLLALLLLLNPSLDETTITTTSDVDPVLVDEAKSKLDEYLKKDARIADLDDEQPIDVAKLTKSEILTTAQDIANVKSKYYQVVTVGDDRTCDKCKQWEGKVISDTDPNYLSYDDLEKSGALHPNCRCFLKPVEKKDSMNSETELDNMAMNAEPLKDTIVYRGFVDQDLDENITYDFGETLVMITPLGEFVGSSQDGKSTKEIVDEESIKLMASQTEEILLDRDHSSMRNVTDRDTSACGWISGLKAVTHLGDMSGLYAIIKWTSEGIRLVKDRIYRFLSPVFQLDENGRATKLINVGLTNRPALKMLPIINSESNDDEKTISITKEKDMEEIKEEAKEENTEVVENSCVKEEKKEVKNEQTVDVEEKTETVEVKEEVKKEVKEEPVVVEDKEEIIKEEVLNSTPTIGADITGKNEWENLRGESFFKYLKDHPEVYKNL